MSKRSSGYSEDVVGQHLRRSIRSGAQFGDALLLQLLIVSASRCCTATLFNLLTSSFSNLTLCIPFSAGNHLMRPLGVSVREHASLLCAFSIHGGHYAFPHAYVARSPLRAIVWKWSQRQNFLDFPSYFRCLIVWPLLCTRSSSLDFVGFSGRR